MLHLYLMTVFYKVMSIMERVSWDLPLTSIARFRGHHINLVGARFKTDKNEMFAYATCNKPSGKLCQRSGRCRLCNFSSRAEKKLAVTA